MKKRINIVEMVFSFLLVVALVHSVVHFSVFIGEAPNSGGGGVSGFLTGGEKVGEELKGRDVWNSFSRIFVVLEWISVGIFILFLHFRQRSGAEEEYTAVKSLVHSEGTKTETDLDRLYEVLKIKKVIRLSTISKVFNVNKEVAMDWCKTLEMGNFASIDYPRFGEPQLVLEESEGDENEEK